jgi:hypothetical protein
LKDHLAVLNALVAGVPAMLLVPRLRIVRSFPDFLGFLCLFFLVPRLNREADRLEQAEETAEMQLLRAQQEVNEAIARLSRIRRQKRLLRERGVQAIVDGLSSVEADESSAPQVESQAVVDVQSMGALDVIDWDSVFDPSSFVGEIPSEVAER